VSVASAATKRLPPGPRGLEIAGFFGRGGFGDTLDFLNAQARRHGPIFAFRIFGHRVYVPTDPELVRQVLVVQQHRFARAAGSALLREIVGTSIVTAEEPLHRERRRMLQPAFHRHRVARYAEAMCAAARETAGALRDFELWDAGDAMTRLTLEVTGRTLFGSDVGAHAREMSASLSGAMAAISRLGPLVEVLPPEVAGLRRHLPLPVNARLRKARADLRTIVLHLIALRRAREDEGPGDVLDLALAARDERGARFDDEALGDELATLLLAGHETTASALTWAWYLLARYPVAAARLRTETANVCGDRDPEPADLPALRYADAVVSETLRLYPPASAFGRRTLEPCELGGYAIPAGASVVISPYAIGRNPRYFREPERFAPERWFGEPPPEFAYVPFGGGARRCIGDAFARMEAVLALATLARRYRFSADDLTPIGIASATLRPARPVLLRAAPLARRSKAGSPAGVAN
jgi:cytochrome P450